MIHKPNDISIDAVSIQGLRFAYPGGGAALGEIDLRLQRGRTLALLGPSGCGKTTLLRLIAGLLAPTQGRILFAGSAVADAATGAFVPPERRNLGMVFQDYALWPHLPVAGNVAFPLEMRGVARAERDARVKAALARVGLSAYAERRVSDMSGGQQQRVAIARAIVAEPDLVLFDEPLSNLDRELRETMVGELAALVAQLGLTALYVTHDQGEAFSLAHDVAVMRAGLIEQLAPPEDLAGNPGSAHVAEFLRLGAVVAVTQENGVWRLAGTNIRLPDPPIANPQRVLIASRDVRPGAGALDLRGTVQASVFRGDGHWTRLRVGPAETGFDLSFLAPSRAAIGAEVALHIDPAALRWFAD